LFLVLVVIVFTVDLPLGLELEVFLGLRKEIEAVARAELRLPSVALRVTTLFTLRLTGLVLMGLFLLLFSILCAFNGLPKAPGGALGADF
jgi:hypothetical protein